MERAETRARLNEIWSRMLQLPSVDSDANFFDLGGDSLMAVGLFLEIERNLGVKLPITAIYDAPTIAELAQLIEGETVAPAFDHFVTLKPGDDSAPLFIVHGVGGTVIELANLGRRIRSPKAVYAIQARGLDGLQSPLERIEDMAALYVEEIRRRQPVGPYCIGGYSFGGVVALEMARLLGPQNVAQLLMIDAFAHPRTWPLKSRATVRARKLVRRLREIARQPMTKTVTALRRKALGMFRDRQTRKAERAAYMNSWLGAVNPNLPLPLRQTRVAGDAALIAYAPRPYPGKATFIRAGKTGPVFPSDAANVWRGLTGAFELHTTQGDHRSILGEHAPALAERISACLAPPVIQPERKPVRMEWRTSLP
jgi:thioesterase domain-containing protein/acyl carrier protein